MCCDAGYETKDSKLNAQINAWGAKLTGLVHSNLLAHNPKHGIFLDSCLHHCGGWVRRPSPAAPTCLPAHRPPPCR